MQRKIVLIDNNEIIVKGLEILLKNSELYKDIKTFYSIHMYDHLFIDDNTHIILVNADISIKEDVIHFISYFKSKYKTTKLMAYSYNTDIEYLIRLINGGCDGYININEKFNEILFAINEVCGGNIYIPPDILPQLNHRLAANEIVKGNVDNLTKREMQILKNVAKGLLNKEIAVNLNISERTVKNHISNIFKKIKVTDRTQAAVYAIKHGIEEI